MVLQFIAMLAPPLLAAGVYDHLHRGKLTARRFWISYALFTIFINICMYLACVYIFNIRELSFDAAFFIKYLIFAIILACVLPLIVNAVDASVSVEIKRNGPKD